ncbi:MAG: chorismate mutase [Bacteroidales bacterium]
MNTSETKIRKPTAALNGTQQPMIIAGPCSAETPEQLMETARSLARDSRVEYFRAGIWKPRTSPDSFEGVGVPGLGWLQDVKKETGLKVTTEVGSEKHVEEALKVGIDMLWIGARTVSNPFIIQEIAEALRGVDIPVLVKNPLSPDIDLWEGAIKRLVKSGLKDVGAIHRGFFWWGKSHLRNQPFWHIPIELRERMPGLRIICDPSHIAGKRSFIPLLAQRALENHFAGLMVEVHPSPDNAWSDPAQQLTPDSFHNMLNDLLGTENENTSQELLDELRSEIDVMDEMLVWALAARMELSSKIAKVKREKQMEPLQSQRWDQVMLRVKDMAMKSGLKPRFVEKLYASIHQESLKLQKTLISNGSNNIKKEHNFVGERQ